MKLNLRNRYSREVAGTGLPKTAPNPSPRLDEGPSNTARRSTNVIITIKKRPGNQVLKSSLSTKNTIKKSFDFSGGGGGDQRTHQKMIKSIVNEPMSTIQPKSSGLGIKSKTFKRGVGGQSQSIVNNIQQQRIQGKNNSQLTTMGSKKESIGKDEDKLILHMDRRPSTHFSKTRQKKIQIKSAYEAKRALPMILKSQNFILKDDKSSELGVKAPIINQLNLNDLARNTDLQTEVPEKILNLRLKTEENEGNASSSRDQNKPQEVLTEWCQGNQGPQQGDKSGQRIGPEQSTYRPDQSRRLAKQPSGLLLEDFSSKVLKINQVPKNASQTCSGQRLIKPVVDPVLYQSHRASGGAFSEETIEYFKLSGADLQLNAKANNHKFDHVRQNIKLAAHINHLRGIQLAFKKTVLAKNNPQNLKLLQEKRRSIENQRRKEIVVAAQRWDKFRDRRKAAIDLYIAHRRRQQVAEEMCKKAFLTQILHLLSDNYGMALRKQELAQKGRFMALTIGQKWRARMKHFYFYKIDPEEKDKDVNHNVIVGAMEKRIERKVRLLVTYGVAGMHATCEERAVVQLKPFVRDMKDHFRKRKLKICCEEYYRKIEYMQRKIKAAVVYRQNKIEGLLSYWDKIVGKLGRAASKRNDEATKGLVFKKLLGVNKELQRAVLERYLKKCIEVHAIAFLQWRAMYPTKFTDPETLEELTRARITNFRDGFALKQKPKAKTQAQGKINEISKFYKQYKGVFEQQPQEEKKKTRNAQPPQAGTKAKGKQADQPYLINNLPYIGWQDPFPDKESGGAPQALTDLPNLPNVPGDLVYAQSRYTPGCSPSVVYIPKKAIMFKLARACLACQSPDDLWFCVKEKNKDMEQVE